MYKEIDKFIEKIEDNKLIKVVSDFNNFKTIEYFNVKQFKNFINLEYQNIDILDRKLIFSDSYIRLFDEKTKHSFYCTEF